MKPKHTLDNTSNAQVYKKAFKGYLESKKLKCSRCPFHDGENGHKPQRSWKKKRKTKFKEA